MLIEGFWKDNEINAEVLGLNWVLCQFAFENRGAVENANMVPVAHETIFLNFSLQKMIVHKNDNIIVFPP